MTSHLIFRYSTTVSILGRLSELIPAASSTHHTHISSSSSTKHSSKSKNQTPEAFSEATVASSQQDVSGGAEFTAMVALPPKPESESESTSAEFQIGIDMLANVEDTALTGEMESVAHSEAFIEMPQSDATVEQSSVEFKSDVIHLEQEEKQQEQKVEQEETGMSVDLMGSETATVVKSQSAQMEIELMNGNEMKSETIVAELQSPESASIAEVNSVAISSVEGTTPTDEVAEGIRP